MIAYRPLVQRPARRLAQAAPSPMSFVVADMRGRVVSGIQVTVAGVSGTTDSSGKIILNVGAGPYDVLASRDGYHYAIHVDAGHQGDVFIALPVCIAQPVLTVPEIGSLAAAVAITCAGYYWKFEPAKVAGEVLFGATVFTALYRLSCL